MNLFDLNLRTVICLLQSFTNLSKRFWDIAEREIFVSSLRGKIRFVKLRSCERVMTEVFPSWGTGCMWELLSVAKATNGQFLQKYGRMYSRVHDSELTANALIFWFSFLFSRRFSSDKCPTITMAGFFSSSHRPRSVCTFCALCPKGLITSFWTRPKPFKNPSKVEKVPLSTFFRHFETVPLFSALWDFKFIIFSEIFLLAQLPPSVFFLHFATEWMFKGSPLLNFLALWDLPETLKKFRKKFGKIFFLDF